MCTYYQIRMLIYLGLNQCYHTSSDLEVDIVSHSATSSHDSKMFSRSTYNESMTRIRSILITGNSIIALSCAQKIHSRVVTGAFPIGDPKQHTWRHHAGSLTQRLQMARGFCRHAPGIHEKIDLLSTTYIHTAQRSRASPIPDLLGAATRQLNSCMLSTPKLRSSGDQFRARRKRADLILATRLRGFVLSTYRYLEALRDCTSQTM